MARALRSRKVYSLADVVRLTGAKRPQIEYWVRKDILRGEFEGGQGLPRQFVFRNLVEVSIALRLTTLGISTPSSTNCGTATSSRTFARRGSPKRFRAARADSGASHARKHGASTRAGRGKLMPTRRRARIGAALSSTMTALSSC